MAAAPGKKRLKILCLHGNRQNAEIFSQRTRVSVYISSDCLLWPETLQAP